MNHCMIDMETLGTDPRSVVLSVGIVAFTKEGLGDEMLWDLTITDQLKAGRKIDADTLHWWMSQGETAKEVFAASKNGIGLRDFLPNFQSWVNAHGGQHVLPWSNGATFDIVIMEDLFKTCNMVAPWKYWNARCYRTLKASNKNSMKRAFEGVKHNALDDARHQALCVIDAIAQNPALDA